MSGLIKMPDQKKHVITKRDYTQSLNKLSLKALAKYDEILSIETEDSRILKIQADISKDILSRRFGATPQATEDQENKMVNVSGMTDSQKNEFIRTFQQAVTVEIVESV